MIFDKKSDLMTVTLPYGLNFRACQSLMSIFMSIIFFSIFVDVISPISFTLKSIPRTVNLLVHSIPYLPSQFKLLSLVAPILTALVLSTFIPRPDTFLNHLRILISLLIASSVPSKNKVVSSVYCEITISVPCTSIPLMSPHSLIQ